MKKILLILSILLLTASCVSAASNITFQWNANTEADLAGYKLYQSDTTQVYSGTPIAIIAADQTTYQLLNVADGTYFWVLTAFDTDDNESGFSNEVTVSLDTQAPNAPNLNISIIIKVVVD